MAAKLVCVVLLSSCLSMAEEEIARGQYQVPRGQYQRLRSLFNRRRLGGEKGVSTENIPAIITKTKKGTKVQKSSEVEKLAKDLQSKVMKSKSLGNDAFLIKLLDNIDIGDSRLFGKTSTTRRPDRFRPSTVQEQIRKKAKSTPTTELPTVKSLGSSRTTQERMESTTVGSVKMKEKLPVLRRDRKRKTVRTNIQSNDKTSRIKIRRRKQNLQPVDTMATDEENKVIINTEPVKMEDENDKEVNEIIQPRKLSDLNDQTKIRIVSLLKAVDKVKLNHPVFESFPIVESERQTRIPNQNDVYQSESLGLNKSHTDYISMLSEIQEEQNFDLAALKSEMNAIKLNQQFFQSVPLKPAFMIELEYSQPLGKEKPDQQITKYQPERLSVLSLPTSTASNTKPTKRMNKSRQHTTYIKKNLKHPVDPRQYEPYYQKEVTNAPISPLSWDQLAN